MPSLLEDRVLGEFFGVQSQLVFHSIGFGTAVSMLGLYRLSFSRMKLGRAMRAVSHDTRVAALMGIPVDRVISFSVVSDLPSPPRPGTSTP